MSWLDILLIIRGYRRRHILEYQLARITAYSAFFATRDNDGSTPQDWLPLYIDDYIDDGEPDITDDEALGLQGEMKAINAKNEII